MSDQETDYMNAQAEADAKENEIMERTKELQDEVKRLKGLLTSISEIQDRCRQRGIGYVKIVDDLAKAALELK